MESNYDKVMRIGKEIIIRLDAKSLEMDLAADAEKKAAEEAEKAAIAGDEKAFAEAKQKQAEARNRYEMLQIRARNHVPVMDMTEPNAALAAFVIENKADIREAFKVFLSQFDEMSKSVEKIIDLGNQYNTVMNYWKNYVLKTSRFPYPDYAAAIYPIKIVMDMTQRFKYQREQVEKLINDN